MPEKSKTYENSAPRVYIRTFGCQMNVADSEWMRSILASAGYEIADREENADVVLLNTCSVRELAEQKVWSKLGELQKKYGAAAPAKKIIGVVGCMAQNYGKKIFDRAPYVNIVCGSYRFNHISELINKVVKGSTHVLDIERKDDDIDGINRHLKKVKLTAFVPIMRGCNNKCSYCVVPYVRGPERSRPVGEIINEIKTLSAEGYKEVTLLGQNVNSYRCSLRFTVHSLQNKGMEFVDLLREVNDIEGLERIRFVTSHPKDATVDLFNAIRNLEKVCEYLHLPVQSGSNNILKLMNRGYTREHYLGLVKDLSGISVSTDIIVGFPGETEKDFQDTYDLMKEVEFDSAFIFKYSVRQGTPAEKLKDDVPLKIKKERNNILLDLQNMISLARNKKLIGSELEVLVEGTSKTNKNRLMGRTRKNKIVVFEGTNKLIGRLVNVKIEEAPSNTLFGSLPC